MYPAPPPFTGTPGNGRPAGQIFVSYRRDDTSHVAGRLSDRLEERFRGAHVFMDVDTIEPGADFVAAIEDAVSACDVLVAMIGRRWLDLEDAHGRRRIDRPDDYVTLEIAAALDRGIPVIPVLVDSAEMPRAEELPESLKAITRRNAARLDHETFRVDIQPILTAVDRVIRARTPPPPRPPAASSQPARPLAPPLAHRAAGQAFVPRSDAPRTEPRTTVARHVVEPGASRSSPARGIPLHRKALRIALWWTLGFLVFFTTFGTAHELTQAAHDAGAYVGVPVMWTLTALAVHLLRREIRAQRTTLDRADQGQDDPGRRPVSVRHIRQVTIGAIALPAVLGLLMALTPATSTTAGQGTPDTTGR